MVRSRPVTTVAELAVSGLTNREIADRLHISVRTVFGHLLRMFDKIKVTSRARLRLRSRLAAAGAGILTGSRHQGVPWTSLT